MGAPQVSTPFSQFSFYSTSISSFTHLHLPDLSTPNRKFSPAFSVNCALPPRESSRRLVSVSLFSLYCTCSIPKRTSLLLIFLISISLCIITIVLINLSCVCVCARSCRSWWIRQVFEKVTNFSIISVIC